MRSPSRRAAIACVLALALAAVVLHREVLFAGDVYHMDDAADGYYPGHIAVARAFAHRQLPTWERGSWAGWPLVVDPYNGVFYPPNVIYYLAGAARGLGWAVALHVFLGGLGMWRLLRRRGLSLEAALFGGLAYELSTFGVVRIRHVIFVQMAAWLPWILVGVERWLATRRPRELALTAVAAGLALLAGALSIGHFALLVLAGYTVARCIPSRRTIAEAAARARRVGADLLALGGAALIGALIAAAQILPTVAHLPLSPRALASDYRFASSYAWPHPMYLVTLIAPDFFGGEDRAFYVGAPNHWELCGWYVGALCVVLAPLALLPTLEHTGAARPARRSGPERAVLVALVLLGIALALGDAWPVHRFFYRHVPLYAALRCPARALLMAVLALPILGAHGLEWLLERSQRWRHRLLGVPPSGSGGTGTVSDEDRPAWSSPRAWWRAALVAFVLLLAVALALAGLRHFGRTVAGPMAATTWMPALRHLAPVLVAGALVVALSILLPRRAVGALFALVLALDLLGVGRRYVELQHRPADYPAGMERFAAVEWLLRRDPPRPPDADGGGDRFVNDPRGPFRLHNVGMVLGLENASGYDSVPIWRYVEFLHLLETGRRYRFRELRDDFAAIGVHNLSSRLLDLMNVRWLLAGEPPPGPGGSRWVERFRPAPPTGAPAAKYEAWWDPRMKVFENTSVLPRAFVAHRAEVPGSDDRLAARLVAPDFDPGATVLLEEPAGLPLGDGARPPTPARPVAAGRHRLVFDTDDPLPGVLVVSDAYYPGWSATVDGAEARLLRADFAFRGVPLPAGRHRVELRYRSRPTEIGLALSAAGAFLALGLALAGRTGGEGGRTARRTAGRETGPQAGRRRRGCPTDAVL